MGLSTGVSVGGLLLFGTTTSLFAKIGAGPRLSPFAPRSVAPAPHCVSRLPALPREAAGLLLLLTSFLDGVVFTCCWWRLREAGY